MELPPEENDEYSRVNAELSAKAPRDPNYFAKILASDEYSFDFKKKLVFHYSSRKVARSWAAINLRSQALCEFIDMFASPFNRPPTREDLENFLANPTFVHSIGEQHDPFIKMLVTLKMSPTDQDMASVLVELIVQKKQITTDIAELVIAVNQNEAFKNRPHIVMLPIINWARELYNFDETMPDSWVIKFLEEDTAKD